MKRFAARCALAALLLVGAGCRPGSGPAPRASAAPAGAPLFAVTTRPVPPPPRVRVAREPDGELVEVACGTCHATTEPKPGLRDAAQLKDFHQGLQLRHGDLACLACHNRADYDSLRLANGESVAFPDVMTLCAQCHGPQWRDYQHGAHGGMSGHWDLARGGRVRNACVHCHDPHVPKVQPVQPAPGPADRFLPRAGKGDSHV